MPFPTLTFAEMLSNSTREELQQLLALLEGYLRVEHDDSGRHTDVTADSVTVEGNVEAGGAGIFDGNVTAQADTDAAKAVLGNLAGLVGSEPSGYGVLVGGETDGFAIYVRTAAAPHLGSGNELRIYDLSDPVGAGVAVLRLVYDSASARHLLGIPSGSVVAIGEDASGKRITEINVQQVLASLGYKERGRSAYLGDFTTIAYANSNFKGAGVDADWNVASGDQTTFAYKQEGGSCTVLFTIRTSTVTNTPASLDMTVPVAATGEAWNVVALIDAGARTTGFASITVGTPNTINVLRTDGAAFTNAVDTTYVLGSITYPCA